MNIKQRDIVLLPVPFSDQTANKVRPAIVVSNDKINTTGDDIILVPITSVLKDNALYSVIITPQNLSEGNLIAVSRARADKVFTAHKSLICMKIGVIRNHVFDEIKKEITKTL